MPSLLASLLSNHLDPGYAAAAAERASTGRRSRPVWHAIGALLIAAVFVGAVAQARSTAPGVTAARASLAANVHTAQDRVDQLSASRNALAAESDQVARRELTADATGRALLARLTESSLASRARPVASAVSSRRAT